jgi:hypothetical protein
MTSITKHLLVLGGEVHDRVAHQVSDLEPTGDPDGREIADGHPDVVAARLGP